MVLKAKAIVLPLGLPGNLGLAGRPRRCCRHHNLVITALKVTALRVTALRAVLGLFTIRLAALFGLVCSYFSSLSPVNALAEALL